MAKRFPFKLQALRPIPEQRAVRTWRAEVYAAPVKVQRIEANRLYSLGFTTGSWTWRGYLAGFEPARTRSRVADYLDRPHA